MTRIAMHCWVLTFAASLILPGAAGLCRMGGESCRRAGRLAVVSPRDEIRPEFAFDASGGPDGQCTPC